MYNNYIDKIFLYQDLVATTGVPDYPFAVVATGQKTLKTQKEKK